MTADKDIGRLEGKLDMLCTQVGVIHGKLDTIIADGCTRGVRNSQDIDELDQRITKDLKDIDARVKQIDKILTKAVIIGLVMAGGGAGTVQMLKVFLLQ